MKDSLKSLTAALHRVFHLESIRNGKYVYAEVEDLKHAAEHFFKDPFKEENFLHLTMALIKAKPYIERWHINFKRLQNTLNTWAINCDWPDVTWDVPTKNSLQFQFQALHQKNPEMDLFGWLTAKSGERTVLNNSADLIPLLLKFQKQFGFSQKLSAHLKNDPEFLFRLINESAKNFTQIVCTRLILFLNDQQLAKAILKHTPSWSQEYAEQSHQLKAIINDMLSNGFSLKTIARNAEANVILKESIFFQQDIKEEEELPKNNSFLSGEEQRLKPIF